MLAIGIAVALSWTAQTRPKGRSALPVMPSQTTSSAGARIQAPVNPYLPYVEHLGCAPL